MDSDTSAGSADTVGAEPPGVGESVVWHLVIPVRSPSAGKSRLGALVGSRRPALARAIAQDTIAAAAAARTCQVLVVTDDDDLSDWCTGLGVQVLADPGVGLNAAVFAGLGLAGDLRRAALLGDLPALTADDLDAALTAALRFDECYVPDADGIGTVLRAGRSATPAFGPESAKSHAALGASSLDLPLPRLRRDVDDGPSLAAALALGVGPHTRTVLAELAMGTAGSIG